MKDQFVIACLGDMSMTDTVVSHAAFLARMLNKGLILLYVADKRYRGMATPDEVERELVKIEERLPDLRPAHVAMKGSLKEVVTSLPKVFNGVVAVTGVNAKSLRKSPTYPAEVLRNFSDCAMAYLTVQEPLRDPERYEKVAFSVDFNRESKDKLLWASYFARFNKSSLLMLHFPYSDERLHRLWKNNIQFMDKFFGSLGLSYRQHPIEGHPLFAEMRVCEEASKLGCGVLVTLTTDLRKRDVLEWFIGTQEQRTIRNADRLPVLFLNPRDDFYVLCD